MFSKFNADTLCDISLQKEIRIVSEKKHILYDFYIHVYELGNV